jgi:hypothetical protein
LAPHRVQGTAKEMRSQSGPHDISAPCSESHL